VSGGIAQLFLNPGKEPVSIVQEVGWAPEPAWIRAENLAPPGFDPRTLQPVAGRYTDYAIPASSMDFSQLFILLLKIFFTSLFKLHQLFHSGQPLFLFVVYFTTLVRLYSVDAVIGE
jgi:hypothetical protein